MTEAPDRLLAAIGLRLFSVLCLSVMTALVKLAETRGARLSEILFFRQAVGVPVLATLAALGPGLGSLRTGRIGAHVLRAAVGLSAMACLFATVLLLPLAEATTLQFTVPIFATILGALVLREPTGWHRWAAVTAGFAGVLIVAQPGAGFPLAGAAGGLGYGLLTAIVSILLRSIGRTERPLTTVFWFATLSMLPLSGLYVLSYRAHPAGVWMILLAIGFCGTMGQIALTSALRLAPVSVVVPMDYSALLWATLFGWLLFGTVPGAATWLGAPVIVASGLYIVWREHVRRRALTAVAIS